MLAKASPDGYALAVPGIQLKTLCHGERTLLAEFRLAAAARLPAHAHPHEQTGYLVSGHLALTIGEETYDVTPGDSWCILSGVMHEAEAIADSLAIEVFSPVREDYIRDRTRQ